MKLIPRSCARAGLACTLTAAVLAGTGGCSASQASGTGTGTARAASPGGPATSATGPTRVAVDMTEWSVSAAPAAAKAGPVTFAATNRGADVHELVLFRTDLDPSRLPLDEEGAVDERGAGVELVDEVENVQPGQSKSFAVTDLGPGRYLLVCNLVEGDHRHFHNGMYSQFTVS